MTMQFLIGLLSSGVLRAGLTLLFLAALRRPHEQPQRCICIWLRHAGINYCEWDVMSNSSTPTREASSSREPEVIQCESIDTPNHEQKVTNAVSPAINQAISLNSGREKLTTEIQSSKSCNKSGGQSSKPDCYKCKHRGALSYSAHSQCNHKMAMEPSNRALTPLLIVTGVRTPPLVKLMNVSYDEHGAKSGWFMWPVDFDPTWLNHCDGFEQE